MPAAVPTRRRRHSGSDSLEAARALRKKAQSIEHLEVFLRPNSARPLGGDDDAPEDFAHESEDSDTASSVDNTENLPPPVPVSERRTKPLPPNKKQKNENTTTEESTTIVSPKPRAARPVPILSNPSLVPQQARPPAANSQSRRLIVVLEQACLEAYRASSGGSGSGKKGKSGGEAKYALLNCDDHQGILAKTGRDIADARPDITHQCLLTLLDSPLNKAGLLQVYIHTTKGVLIEINPHVRIPRTFKRFSGLMVQLLHRLFIRGVNGPEKLLKVIKNPVTDHFPVNTYKLTLSGDAPTIRLSRYLPTLPETHSIAVFVGAMARGRDNFADGIVDEKISISDYPLSASVACGKFCCAVEEMWDIV
ncbi:Nep1-domain-containing protein [Fomitiporia mediterranea MF3/22]|uniref:Nep1-domain-containing protein n=1 Tax=Fomitiporia mediterranea (strain MF3/22) TaxID=694068 RepID=UPI0004408C88|nr:Nep1-domain-containing protein [Fomitiporia mediterranea MF3/22]EJD00781.1 Nep1-domain-containing protein [Fomitiporia mediterranea MF3/22]